MITAPHLGRDILADIRTHRRALLAFHVYFVLLGLSTLTPASAWLLAAMLDLSGHPMVGNEDLLSFVITPLGLTWLVLSGTLAAVFIFLHHAGMMLVTTRDAHNHYCTATSALWRVAHQLPRLLRLAGLQVATHLLVAAPFLLLLVLSYQWLLGGYDIYYVINEHPPALWQFLALTLLISTGLLMANGSLYLRWVFALPCLLLQEQKPLNALRTSGQLSKGLRLSIAVKILSIAALVALFPILLSAGFDYVGAAVLRVLPERYNLLIPIMALLLLTYVLSALVVAFFGVSANSLAILKLYQRCQRHECMLPPDPEPPRTCLLAWSGETLLVLLALGQIFYAINAFDTREQVLISAHRGSSLLAPENTHAAIERAIVDGADFVELDVRETADGVLVLLHDRDLLRVAGDRRNIWEVDFEELRTMDVGAWFSPEFKGQTVPTLDEAIAQLRGRAQLYLEIKTSPHSPNLVRNTLQALQDQHFVEHTIIAALSPQVLLEAQRLAPGIRTSLLVHSAIGTVEGQPFDALALRDALVTPSRLNRVRRQGHELHVWTVNDRRAMARFIDMGVDNIITDSPEILAELLAERAALSDAERLLIRMRNWVW